MQLKLFSPPYIRINIVLQHHIIITMIIRIKDTKGRKIQCSYLYIHTLPTWVMYSSMI